jgi:uncharacterized linocin/CFP29 family protein
MSDHLRRHLAPIVDAAWDEIDNEASRTLKHYLAARRLVDFSGPHGWEYAARTTGRTRSLGNGPVDGTAARLREVHPLAEFRSEFTLSREELDAVERGAEDIDLAPVHDAARRAAMAEDGAIFHGWADAGIDGIGEAGARPPLDIREDYDEYPGTVARAVAALQQDGIAGPFAIALGPRCWRGVIETTHHGGYPIFEHIRLILGGPVVWAPAVDGAVVVSMRGDDFRLTVGEDFSIGYLDHDATTVTLFIEESFTFEVLEPRAAVRLKYPG